MCKTKKILQCPQTPSPHSAVGSGDETIYLPRARRYDAVHVIFPINISRICKEDAVFILANHCKTRNAGTRQTAMEKSSLTPKEREDYPLETIMSQGDNHHRKTWDPIMKWHPNNTAVQLGGNLAN